MRTLIKKLTIVISPTVFIFLFTYTAINKLIAFNGFVFGISRHPGFKRYATAIAITIISLELIATILLLVPQLNRWGFYLTTTLMAAFSFYIATMFWFSDKLPCSCGGVISSLSWTAHLILNIGLTGLALFVALHLNKQENKPLPAPNEAFN